MRRPWPLAAPLLLVLVFTNYWTADLATAKGSAGAQRAPSRFTAHVVKIHDGDTFTALVSDLRIRIRLNGVDAPEIGQAFGEEAKQAAGDLLYDRDVTITAVGTDKYGRTLADVHLGDGRFVNLELVKEGAAWWYRKHSHDKTLATAEAEARDARRGLWADAKPLPPWEYRNTARGETLPGGKQAANVTDMDSGSPTKSSTVIGNRRSRTYHRPDCPGYGDVKPKNRVAFGSDEEAEKAGYRLARKCPKHAME